MIDIEEFKKKLPPSTKQLTQQEIERLFKLQIKLADALFDIWLKKRNNVATDA